MGSWNISEDAAALHRDALVWDMTLPWEAGAAPDLKLAALARLVDSGYTYISLTLAPRLARQRNRVRCPRNESAYG